MSLTLNLAGSSYLAGTVFNIITFGAIGDGATHPLSTQFATLADAQVVYPRAAALTEELDFHATQKAIDTAATAGVTLAKGGTVFAPAGRYMMNNAASTDCFLVFPECRPSGTPGIQVNLRGTGWRSTTFKWAADTGSAGSKKALNCGDPTATPGNQLGRYNATGLYEGVFEDFRLEGPNTSLIVGTASNNLSGIAWGSRRMLNRVAINGFYAALDVVGDWATMKDVITLGNYYGLYFPTPSAFFTANIEFEKCFFTGCAMAGIAINQLAYCGCKFYGCFVGGSPYAIMGEAGSSSGGPNLIARFQDCQFEFIGNGMIVDENGLNAGTKTFVMDRCSFDGCFIATDNSKKITTGGRDRYSMISVHQIKRSTIRTTSGMFAGSVCCFDIDQFSGFSVEGDLSFVAALAVPLVFSSGNSHESNNMLLQDYNNAWAGHVAFTSNSVGCNVNDCLEYNGGTRVQPCTISTLPFVGIAKHTSAAQSYVAVATRGHLQLVNGAGSISSNVWVKKDAAGAVSAASGPTDTMVVGYATTSNSGGGTFSITPCGQNQAGNL